MNAIQFYSISFKFIQVYSSLFNENHTHHHPTHGPHLETHGLRLDFQFYSIVSLLLPRAAVGSSVGITSMSSWRRRRIHEAAPILFAEARFPLLPLLPLSHRAPARLSRTTQLKFSHRKKEILCSIMF